MSLPTTRNTNYADTDPVKSADLNDIQDQIIAMYAGAHGERTIPLALGQPGPPSSGSLPTGSGAIRPESISFTDSLGEGVSYALTLPVGSRILRFRVYVDANADSELLTARLRRNPRAAAVATIATDDISTTGELEVASVYTTIANESYFVELLCDANTNLLRVTSVEVDFDRPS